MQLNARLASTLLIALYLGSPAASAADEVIVTAKQLRELERQVRAAESAMYELFNELNTDDIFDIRCRSHAPPGSRMRVRQCLPRFAEQANEEYAEATVSQITDTTSGGSRRAVNTKLEVYNRTMEEKWQQMAAQNSAFGEAVQRHAALQEQLEASSGRPAADD